MKLNIKQACTENWNLMTPSEQGKHCQLCQKEVVDFTNMSDAEIVQYFKNATGKTCGRLRKTQLNRPLVIPQARGNGSRFLRVAAGVLLLASMNGTLQFAEAKGKETEWTFVQKKAKPCMPLSDEKPKDGEKKNIVSGIIIDKESKLAIADATLTLGGSELKVKTNEKGEFSLEIPEKFQRFRMKIVVEHVDYHQGEFVVYKWEMPLKKEFGLKAYEVEMMLGEVAPE